MTRVLRYVLVIGGAISCILLFLLASASENSASFDRHYPWLLVLNAVVALALLGLVTLLLTRLIKRYRRGKFGSKLMARLVLLFAVVGILPGSVIFLVSVQFVSRSIESWFNVKVEAALESGLNLGRAALEGSLSDLNAKARGIALELADKPDGTLIKSLAGMREQRQEAIVVTANGRVVASVGGQLANLMPDLPTPSMLRQARMSRGYSAIEGDADALGAGKSEANAGKPEADAAAPAPGGLRLRVVVAIPGAGDSLALQREERFLQLLAPVPSGLATNAEALRAAYSEYQERSLARTGLRKIYITTLTLTQLLAIFGAIASAFLIASDLAKPLLLLAEGTKAVAEGNLSPRPIVASADELGTLTQSFNTMTKQLADARASVERNRAELENAKAYLESVLANMSAGVMVLDEQFRLVSCNESVARILKHDIGPHIGEPLALIEGMAAFAEKVATAFAEQNAQSAGAAERKLHWQQQVEIPRAAEGADDLTLLARGTQLPVAGGNGYVVVFDDISDVISAQRSTAWGEVARRLAHEIKNPLTPIQLAAERLQMKLADRLEGGDAAMLARGTATIVGQVSAMKRMVDDFRDYARTPAAVLTPLNLGALIEDILNLYMAGDERDIIQVKLDRGLPLVMGDPTQLRQVIHNLLQNAQDAVADRSDRAEPARIDVAAEAIRYRTPDGKSCEAVRLSITDNGPGFAPKILARAFEPYVTSKPRGTGLGLAMVKKIIDEHGGRIDIQNRSDEKGAKVAILLLKLAPFDEMLEMGKRQADGQHPRG